METDLSDLIFCGLAQLHHRCFTEFFKNTMYATCDAGRMLINQLRKKAFNLRMTLIVAAKQWWEDGVMV